MTRRIGLLVATALVAACGGGADASGDLKPLWPTYAETEASAPVETAAPVETGPPPIVLVLPSLGCGACYRKTTQILAEHPEGLRRHAIDVPSRRILLYPIEESYRPDAIVAALERAGYVATIETAEAETVPEL